MMKDNRNLGTKSSRVMHWVGYILRIRHPIEVMFNEWMDGWMDG